MRKLLLVTAMVLISASAEAGQSRSLSLASVDEQAATPSKPADTTAQSNANAAQPIAIKSAETSATDTPKYVERPPGVTAAPATTSTQPQSTDTVQPAASHAAKAGRSRHRTDWSEARIIGELHRHGIYW
jgi:flagellar hook-length control protein FliK